MLFELLESFTDGMGAWRFLPEDAHLLKQPEPVIEDLLQWKMLASIIEKKNRKKEVEDENAGTW